MITNDVKNIIESNLIKQIEDSRLKDIYFNSIFKERIIEHHIKVDKKCVDGVIVINNKVLESFYNHLYTKFNAKCSKHDFISECTYHTYVAINRFEAPNWDTIVDGTNNKWIGKLITYIKRSVEGEIIRFLNPNNKYTTMRDESGKIINIAHKIEFSSIDEPIAAEHTEDILLVNLLSSDDALHANRTNYVSNHFKIWFNENKHKLLTDKQIQFLEDMQKCSHTPEGYTKNDMDKVLNFDSKNRFKRFDAIKRVAINAYKLVDQKLSIIDTMILKEKEAISNIMEIMYSDDTTDELLSIALIEALDNDQLSNIMYDSLQDYPELTKELVSSYNNKTKLNNKIMYHTTQSLQNRLDYLIHLGLKSKSLPEEPSKKNKVKDRKNSAHKNGPAKYYDLYQIEEDGEETFLGTFKDRSNTPKKTNNILQINTKGILTMIDTKAQ